MLALYHNYFHTKSHIKHGNENGQPNKKRFIFGLFILFLVDILWVASSELTKYIYTEKYFEKPFLVTYMRCSVLIVYLLVLCVKRQPRPTQDYTQLHEPAEIEEERYFTESTASLGDPTFIPVRAGETTDSDDAAPRAVRFNKVAEVRVMSAAQAGEALLARLSWSASVRASQHAERRAAMDYICRHVRLALLLSVPWFLANYLYRLSLTNTSPNSTLYLSVSGAFALSMGAVCSQVPGDRFNLTKCIAILLTAVGLVIVGLVEDSEDKYTSIVSGLGAAFCYALHLILLRRELRKGEIVQFTLLAGLTGALCAVISMMLGVALSAVRAEWMSPPPYQLWPLLLADAAIGPLLHDPLWLWGRSLAGSRWASACVCLTVPLSLAGGALAGRTAGVAWLGALLLAAGWAAGHAELTHSPRRNIPELDEQSEALMSAEEPT